MIDPSSLSLFFVGDLNEYSKGYSRLCALQKIGVQTEVLSSIPIQAGDTGHVKMSNIFKLGWKIGIHLDTERINKRILAQVSAFNPDIIWIEKGNMIWPGTLRRLRRLCPDAQLVSYTDDDMFNTLNSTWAYRLGVKYYDTIFTTKSYNTNSDELPALGARSVVMVNKAYDRDQHFPVNLSPEEHSWLKADVGFIGSFERSRAEDIEYLAQQGIGVRVWGNGWGVFKSKERALIVEGRALVNTKRDCLYSKGISATKINLAFLRKANRDLQTDRSIEIPACGGFMIAEYSEEHAALFEENKEAVFFRSRSELVEKIQYYLKHDDLRIKIAEAGRKRCLKDDYSQKGRMLFMLDTLSIS